MTFLSDTTLKWGITLLLFAVMLPLSAQQILSLKAERDDSLRAWEIESDSTDFDGELYFRFTNDVIPRYWDYRTGELAGTIKATWDDNPNDWVLDGMEIDAQAKTTWRGQFHRWNVDIGGKRIIWEFTQDKDGYFWEIKDKPNGSLFMYMEWEDDMRDWIIEDYMSEDFPYEGKVFLVFLAMFSHMVK